MFGAQPLIGKEIKDGTPVEGPVVRKTILRDLRSLAPLAGANGLIVGNYLTTPGRNAEDDFKMIKDLGFQLKKS